MKKKVKDFTQFEIDTICDSHLCEDCPFKNKNFLNDDCPTMSYYCEANKNIKKCEEKVKELQKEIEYLKLMLEEEIEIQEKENY